MPILFNINDYLNLPVIIAFGIGILLGFLLLLLLYLLAVIKGMNKELKRKRVEESNVDINEVNWLINEAKIRYKNLEKEKHNSSFVNLFDVSKNLAHDIASKFYPKSKRPLQELTVDEILVLTHYISDRIDDLLQAKILKMFRKMTIKQILELKNTGQKIVESKIYKTTAGAKLNKVWQAVKVVNPFYWIKKGTVDQAIKIIIKKIALNSIVITGEETYKIYSKKIFEAAPDNETQITELQDIIENEGDGDNVKKTKGN